MTEPTICATRFCDQQGPGPSAIGDSVASTGFPRHKKESSAAGLSPGETGGHQLSDALRLNILRRDLEDRRGPGRAITIAQIGALLGHRCRRETESFLELHVGDLPFCVVSSAHGYYRPAAAEDINHYRNSIRSRIRCLAIRARTVQRVALAEGWRREGKQFVNIPVAQDLFERRPA